MKLIYNFNNNNKDDIINLLNHQYIKNLLLNINKKEKKVKRKIYLIEELIEYKFWHINKFLSKNLITIYINIYLFFLLLNLYYFLFLKYYYQNKIYKEILYLINKKEKIWLFNLNEIYQKYINEFNNKTLIYQKKIIKKIKKLNKIIKHYENNSNDSDLIWKEIIKFIINLIKYIILYSIWKINLKSFKSVITNFKYWRKIFINNKIKITWNLFIPFIKNENISYYLLKLNKWIWITWLNKIIENKFWSKYNVLYLNSKKNSINIKNALIILDEKNKKIEIIIWKKEIFNYFEERKKFLNYVYYKNFWKELFWIWKKEKKIFSKKIEKMYYEWLIKSKYEFLSLLFDYSFFVWILTIKYYINFINQKLSDYSIDIEDILLLDTDNVLLFYDEIYIDEENKSKLNKHYLTLFNLFKEYIDYLKRNFSENWNISNLLLTYDEFIRILYFNSKYKRRKISLKLKREIFKYISKIKQKYNLIPLSKLIKIKEKII